MSERILIVGASGSSHIGGSLQRGAQQLGISAEFCDISAAWRLGTLQQKIYWHFFGRRPVALQQFSRHVIQVCRQSEISGLISTGNAPISAQALSQCRRMGIRTVNFSTDDPFNPYARAPWFLEAIREYDFVFTPRTVNTDELRRHGCRKVAYLPFGYDPDLFFPCASEVEEESDIFFAGTAERPRVPFLAAAIEAGLNVRLHGIYWERHAVTRGIGRGQADIPTLRGGIANCRVALVLVRHENRDGHSMRTYEVPAVGACMIVQDTKEHRNLFGAEGENVLYFATPNEMITKAKTVLRNEGVRRRLAIAAQRTIVNGQNSYADRLKTMVATIREAGDIITDQGRPGRRVGAS